MPLASEVTFGWEPLEQLLDDGLEELVKRHWQEIALDKNTTPLDVDWERKLRDEANGQWRVFVARRGFDLIGYISFYIHDSHHNYKSTRYIFDDVFWLAPEERGTHVGTELLSRAFAALPRPSKLQVKIKLTFEEGRVGRILERLGLKPIETVYSAYLE